MWIGILVRNATYVHILLILPTLYFDRVPVPYVSMTQYIYQANAIGVGISKLNFFQKNKMDGVSIQKVSKQFTLLFFSLCAKSHRFFFQTKILNQTKSSQTPPSWLPIFYRVPLWVPDLTEREIVQQKRRLRVSTTMLVLEPIQNSQIHLPPERICYDLTDDSFINFITLQHYQNWIKKNLAEN